jgi:hypothetical protein
MRVDEAWNHELVAGVYDFVDLAAADLGQGGRTNFSLEPCAYCGNLPINDENVCDRGDIHISRELEDTSPLDQENAVRDGTLSHEASLLGRLRRFNQPP